MRSLSLVCAAAFTLAGCATVAPDAPVSLINSLSFDNPMSGMRDGLRSAWPLGSLSHAREHFPLAQVRQCDLAGLCNWGVLSAHRRFGKVRQTETGVVIELDLEVDVDRSQTAARADQHATMTIPPDVGALQAKRHVQRELVLPYGKVERIDLDYGIRFELCAFRLDAARQPVEQCAIPYF